MKEIEVGTKVLVRAEVDAIMNGLNSGPRIRVKIADKSVLVKPEDIQMKPELRLPRGSAKWNSVMDEMCTGNPEDGVTEETDG